MSTQTDKTRAFEKVGECLYRYSSTGVYYARLKRPGKEIRRSLRTTDKALAKRRLAELRNEQAEIDPALEKMSLRELCNDFLETIQHQKPKTVERKELIVGRMKKHWPTGDLTQVRKVKEMDVNRWLSRCQSRYKFGPVSRNLHIRTVQEVFKKALDNKIILTSPAEHIEREDEPDPVRRTPTFEEFKAIVESIRGQKFNGHNAQESADFVEFLGLFGLGQAEASSITRADVHWQRNRITTFRHKTKSGFEIPIYPQGRDLLWRRTSKLKNPDDPLFTIKGSETAVRNACARLNLPHYSLRSFRRMFIRRAIELGIDVKTIAKWQAHKDGGKLILDIYRSDVSEKHEREMATLLAVEQPKNVIPLTDSERAAS
jgi:integrase